MLSDIGNLLTNDKQLFTKYKLVNNPYFRITLELKLVIDKEIFAWCSFDQLIFNESLIDFQNLVLISKGLFFPCSTNRAAALVKANAFVDKLKLRLP